MKWLLSLWLLASIVQCQKAFVSDKVQQFCTGMYNQEDWGGKYDPFIKVNLHDFSPDDDVSVSVVIFEYRDMDDLGYTVGGRTSYVCNARMISAGLCSESESNQFIVNRTDSTPELRNGKYKRMEIISTKLVEIGQTLDYKIVNTGYYCVATYSPSKDHSLNKYKLLVNFQNAYGSLPGSEIPKLPLYGLLAVVYAVCLCVFLFQVFKHRMELLLLQKYLASFFVFLTCENILVWSLYELRNNTKTFPVPAGVKVYACFISILNAFKTSFSLFLLLIISLGYGVVYPKLNRKLMLKCKILAGCHFVFSVVFTIASYFTEQSQPSLSTDFSDSRGTNDSFVAMITSLPVAITLMVFYFLILTSLSKTVRFLNENRQIVKLNMYKRLFRLIVASLLLMLLAVTVTIMLVFNDSLTNSIEKLWKFNKVLTDFWPSVLYFIVFIGIAFIWRPTDTSYMLALSSQIPTTDDGADSEAGPPNESSTNYGHEFEVDDLNSLNSDTFDDRGHSDPPRYSQVPLARGSVEFDIEKERKERGRPSNDVFKLEDEDDEEAHRKD